MSRPAPHPSALQVFDSQTLALFTSSLFLAGLFTAPVASIVTRKHGRKLTMLCAGMSFLIGSGALHGSLAGCTPV